MEELAQTAAEATGTMSQATLLWIIGGLMAVITVLGNVAKSMVDKRRNPLNGTLVELNSTLRQVNTTLAKVDVRAEDSNRILASHTEKLVAMGVATTQLAANEAEQTRALLALGPTIDKALTGCANRITDNCVARSGAILTALDKR